MIVTPLYAIMALVGSSDETALWVSLDTLRPHNPSHPYGQSCVTT